MNNLRISTGQILQLGSHRKSKTVKGLSLNLAEHHMKYFFKPLKILSLRNNRRSSEWLLLKLDICRKHCYHLKI